VLALLRFCNQFGVTKGQLACIGPAKPGGVVNLSCFIYYMCAPCLFIVYTVYILCRTDVSSSTVKTHDVHTSVRRTLYTNEHVTLSEFTHPVLVLKSN